MRLLDRIFWTGFKHHLEGLVHRDYRQRFIDLLLENLAEAQLVVVDNVAQYFFQHHLDSHMLAADFPCIMPPFEVAFMEFRLPAKIRAETSCEEAGVMLTTQPPDHMSDYPELLKLKGVKRHLVGHSFVRPARSQDVFLFSRYVLPLGDEGQIITPSDAGGRIYGATALFLQDMSPESERDNLRFIHQFVNFPIFLALSFMHCRNVEMSREAPPPKLSKAHRKKKGKGLLRYHILKINHMKSVLEREGHASTDGLSRAMHICRGHFATYGSGGRGLLFGRHSGRFWFPMHLRGSAEKGVVTKDYDVE